jgi:hypothetical protein
MDITGPGAGQVPREDEVQAMSFLLAVGFLNYDSDSYKLVASSFETVYSAALTDSIPWDCWVHLDKIAPSRAYIFEWDKCRRLEKALISIIIKNEWPTEMLLMTAKSPRVFWNVIDTAYQSRKGRQLLWQLQDKINSGIVEASPEQENALNTLLA